MPTNILNARARSDPKDQIEEIIDIFSAPEMMTGRVSPDTLNRLQDSYIAKGGTRLNPYMRERNKQQQLARDDIYNVASSGRGPEVEIEQLDKLAKPPMSPEQQAQAFANLYGGNRSYGLYSPGTRDDLDFELYNTVSGRPEDNVSGFQEASARFLGPSPADLLPGIPVSSSGIASLLGMPPDAMGGRQDGPGTDAFNNPLNRFPPGMLQSNYMADSGDLGKMDKNYMAAENNPMAKYTNPLVNVLAGLQTNPRTGKKFDMTNPDDRYDFYNLTQDTVGKEDALIQQRQLDEDRERARLAALTQQQPVDPCPEGYRLDPITRSCVPTDDTTDTTDTTPGIGRVYETMVAPQENYSQVTAPSNIPSISMPDIFTGN